MNAIDKLVLEIVSLKTKGGGNKYVFPIKEISEMKVDCVQIHIPNQTSKDTEYLSLHKNEILFAIDTDYLPSSIYFEWFPFTKQTAKDTIKNIIELLKNLKLDKATNHLRDKRKEKKELTTPQDVYDLLECENLKLEFDECVVCREITNSYFRECKHTICGVCCSKLTIDTYDDCVDCPICRNKACVGSCESDRSDTVLDTH